MIIEKAIIKKEKDRKQRRVQNLHGQQRCPFALGFIVFRCMQKLQVHVIDLLRAAKRAGQGSGNKHFSCQTPRLPSTLHINYM